jgi:hypothetical protein
MLVGDKLSPLIIADVKLSFLLSSKKLETNWKTSITLVGESICYYFLKTFAFDMETIL